METNRRARKTRASVFEFLGDLSSSRLIVFCELQRVLIPEFGDLISSFRRILDFLIYL